MSKIKLVLTTAALIAVLPMAAMAAGENNVGSCGLGYKWFAGKSGIFPQVLAGTTNGYTQSIGITVGTSGCTSDGVVSTNMKTAMYIEGNQSKLAQDMSKGSGESLLSLAKLIGVKDADMVAFNRATKENFSKIFASEQATATQVSAALREVLAADSALAQYSVAI